MAERKEEKRQSSRYWLWSVLFHAAVLGLLLWVIPVREIVFDKEEKPKPKITQRGEKLKETIETIRESEEELLRQRVYLLGLGVDRVRVNYLNKAGRHTGYENAQKAAAFERILENMNAALEGLERKRDLHEDNIGKRYDPEAFAEMQRLDSKIRSREEDTVAALPLLPDVERKDELIQMQKKALEVQSMATDFTRWTSHAESSVLTTIGKRQAAEARIGELKEEIPAHKGAVAVARTAEEAAETAEEAAKQALENAGKDDDKGALRKAYHDARDAARAAKREHQRAQKRLADLEADLTKARDQLADAEERLPKAKAGREQKDGELKHWANLALEMQGHAKKFLLELYSEESVEEALAERQEDATEEEYELVTEPDQPSAPRDQLADQDIVDLYGTSERLIAQAITDYRAFKAIDLARMRDLAVEAALDQIAPLEPLPTEVDTHILRADITDPEMVEPHKKEVVKVKTSVEEKIELVEQLLEQMETWEVEHVAGATPELEEKTLEDMIQKEIYDEEAETMTLEEMTYEEQREAQSEFLEMMEQVAKEEEGQEYKDLTRMMRNMPEEETEEGAEPPPPPVQEGEEEGDEQQSPPPSSAFADVEDGARPPPAMTGDEPGIFGRALHSEGEPVEWMYVDTWYTIGPFPNEHRRNLNTKFPPETVVDLDARYVGKEGKPIEWTFVQSRSPSVVPADAEEYAIYYAYTEIYSDRPRDVWIAVGSDDKANVWINDLPVWISDDRLKGWRINEGYRKVHLKQGRNKVLYRVENGWRGVAFSLTIHSKRQGE